MGAAQPVASLYATIGLKMDAALRGLRQFRGELGNVSSRLKGVADTTRGLSRGLTTAFGIAIPLSLAGMAAVGIRAVADLESSMNVFRLVTNATTEEMAAADAMTRQLSRTMARSGFGSAEAAAALTELGKAGLSAQTAMQATRPALLLASAGQLQAAEAAEVMADALQAFKLPGTEAARIADLLAGAEVAASGSIRDHTHAFRQAAAVYSQSGVSIETLVTQIGLLANAGIKSSDAGTSLKQMLLSLTAPSTEGAAVLRGLGVRVYDASNRMRSFTDIIQDFTPALGRLNEAQRNQYLATIFGSDAVRAASVVFGGGIRAFDEMYLAVTRVGLAEQLATARTSGLAGTLAELQTRFREAAAAGIRPWTAEITGAAQGMSGLLGSFEDMSPEARRLAGPIAALGGVLGSLVPAALGGILGGALGFGGGAAGGAGGDGGGGMCACLVPIGLALAAILVGVLAVSAAAVALFAPVRSIQSGIGNVIDSLRTLPARIGAALDVTAPTMPRLSLPVDLTLGTLPGRIGAWLGGWGTLGAAAVAVTLSASGIGGPLGTWLTTGAALPAATLSLGLAWGAGDTLVTALSGWLAGTATLARLLTLDLDWGVGTVTTALKRWIEQPQQPASIARGINVILIWAAGGVQGSIGGWVEGKAMDARTITTALAWATDALTTVLKPIVLGTSIPGGASIVLAVTWGTDILTTTLKGWIDGTGGALTRSIAITVEAIGELPTISLPTGLTLAIQAVTLPAIALPTNLALAVASITLPTFSLPTDKILSIASVTLPEFSLPTNKILSIASVTLPTITLPSSLNLVIDSITLPSTVSASITLSPEDASSLQARINAAYAGANALSLPIGSFVLPLSTTLQGTLTATYTGLAALSLPIASLGLPSSTAVQTALNLLYSEVVNNVRIPLLAIATNIQVPTLDDLQARFNTLYGGAAGAYITPRFLWPELAGVQTSLDSTFSNLLTLLLMPRFPIASEIQTLINAWYSGDGNIYLPIATFDFSSPAALPRVVQAIIDAIYTDLTLPVTTAVTANVEAVTVPFTIAFPDYIDALGQVAAYMASLNGAIRGAPETYGVQIGITIGETALSLRNKINAFVAENAIKLPLGIQFPTDIVATVQSSIESIFQQGMGGVGGGMVPRLRLPSSFTLPEPAAVQGAINARYTTPFVFPGVGGGSLFLSEPEPNGGVKLLGAGVSASPTGGGDTIIVNLTVQGSVASENDLVDAVVNGIRYRQLANGAVFT